MKRILLTAVLALTAVLSTGCAGDGNSIIAEAPGGPHPRNGVVPSTGTYTLYHVTKFDEWGCPVTTVKVVTLELKAEEHVGFEYLLPKERQYNSDDQSDVIASAGANFRQNLGPVQSIEDHYYWCSPSDWNVFWATRPERVVFRKAVQY